MIRRSRAAWVVSVLLVAGLHQPAPAFADDLASDVRTTDDRDAKAVTEVDGIAFEVALGHLPALVDELRAAHGPGVRFDRSLGRGWFRFELDHPVGPDEADLLADRAIAAGHAVAASPDAPMYPATVPDDTSFDLQWNLAAGGAGIDAPGAWSVTRGSVATVVAVLDTGQLPHPDLAARQIPGYDMISNPQIANDGDGRDPDPTDPGDACPGDQETPARPSSWHGTSVSGVVGAVTDNALGIAGVDHHTRVQHVRVLGRCRGTLLDVADGIRWASGDLVSGVPVNPTPADVINLSLGSEFACEEYLQDAIDVALGNGSIVVAASGNGAIDLDVEDYAPASCDGVIAVTATSPGGDRAGRMVGGQRVPYANHGSTVDIAAPGGDLSSSLWGGNGGVLTTSNSGAGAPNPDGWIYRRSTGTSMAAPHVSGVVALLRARDPSITADQVRAVLQETAQPFAPPVGGSPPEFACSADPEAPVRCGAGIVSAAAAVAAIDAPVMPVAPSPELTAATATGVELQWPAASVGAGPASYLLSATTGPRCTHSVGVEAYHGPATGVVVGGLAPETTYRWCLYVLDGNGQVSLSSPELVVTTPPGAPDPEPDADPDHDPVPGTDSVPGPVPAPGPGAAPSVPGFTDVSNSSPHAAGIAWMAHHGITDGCRAGGLRFCPDEPVTRAQMATFMRRALELSPGPSSRFLDVAPGSTHATAIDAVRHHGITLGCVPGGERYCPTRTVTRAQMATFILRARGYAPGPVTQFTDVSPGSTHAGAIGALVREEVTYGCDARGRSFCPDRPVTRGQMASLLHRALG